MNLKVKFKESEKVLSVSFGETKSDLQVNLGEVQHVTEYIGGEPYDGEYIVTPKISGQSLPTKNKVLVDDVTIKEIPFYNVSNASGGNTVYIGDKI